MLFFSWRNARVVVQTAVVMGLVAGLVAWFIEPYGVGLIDETASLNLTSCNWTEAFIVPADQPHVVDLWLAHSRHCDGVCVLFFAGEPDSSACS